MGLGGSKEGAAEKPRPQDLAPPVHDAPAARRDSVVDEEEDGSVEPDLSSKERLDRVRKYFEEPGTFLQEVSASQAAVWDRIVRSCTALMDGTTLGPNSSTLSPQIKRRRSGTRKCGNSWLPPPLRLTGSTTIS